MRKHLSSEIVFQTSSKNKRITSISLLGDKMVDEKIERLQKLQVFLYGFGMRDRRSVNDAIYIAQNLVSGFPKLYTDFEGFAKLGVSSSTLHEDYSILQEDTSQLPELPENEEMEMRAIEFHR